MSRRSNFTAEEIKKNREKLFGKKRTKLSTYEQNRKDQQDSRNKSSLKTNNSNDKKVTTKKLTGVERAKAMAKKNIKKYGGTAKAAAANKEAMRLKIKKKYLASKKKK